MELRMKLGIINFFLSIWYMYNCSLAMEDAWWSDMALGFGFLYFLLATICLVLFGYGLGVFEEIN